MNKTRLERVRGLMRRRRLEQLIITQPQSIYYLTGEWVAPMDRLDALIITGDDVRMLCYNLAVIEPENCKTVIYSDMGRALPCLMELMERVPTGNRRRHGNAVLPAADRGDARGALYGVGLRGRRAHDMRRAEG